MKKFQFFLAFVAIWLSAANRMSAERIAPTLTSISLDNVADGTMVYIYNVEAEKAMYYNSSTNDYMVYPRDLGEATPFAIYKQASGYYRFIPSGYSKYLCIWNGDVNYIEVNTLNRTYSGYTYHMDFQLRDSIDGLVIQPSPSCNHYTDSTFIGVNSDDRVRVDLTEGNIIWKLVPAETVTGKVALYNALNTADTYGYNVEKYDSIYANENSTAAELNAAATTLNNAISLSRYGNLCGGDVPILLEDDPNHAWGRYNNDYIRRNYDMSAGEQQVLTATVEVNQDATLVYSAWNGNGDPNDDYSWSYSTTSVGNSSVKTEYYRRNDGGTTYYVNMKVYIDGKLVRTIDNNTLGMANWRYFETLAPGKHTIKWVATCPDERNKQYIRMYRIWVYNTPLTTVNLKEPGSLGTEVLAPDGGGLNRIQDVRRLKIKGEMNDADWVQIDNMPALFELDLSEANIKEIPTKQLSRYYKSDSKSDLHIIKLPYTLESIGDDAFSYCYIDEMVFPSTLKSIGTWAFNHTYIKKVILPNTVQSIGKNAFCYCFSLTEVQLPDSCSLGTNVFERCYKLEKINLPKNITAIPDGLFRLCKVLTDCPLHEGIVSVGTESFLCDYKYKANIPTTLKTVNNYAFYNTATDSIKLNPNMSIGQCAFYYCDLKELEVPTGCSLGELAFAYNNPTLKHIVIHEDVSLGQGCFSSNNTLEAIELPTSFYTITNTNPIVRNCTKLKEVKLKSATMVNGSTKAYFAYACPGVGNITLKVPDYLVTTYKQDSYWKDYNIEGFDNSEVDYWWIFQPLTLTYRDRFTGNPSLNVDGPSASLVINGDAAMSINNFSTFHNQNIPFAGDTGMVISNCDNIVINGQVSHKIRTTDNIWYALSLPFDFKPEDIITTSNGQFSIKYYDGANRAQGNLGNNWKDIPKDSIVTAGSGFMYRTSKDCYSYFYAIDNASKQIVVSNTEFAKSLEKYESENAAHKGWNLVGNPYLCYYNIHKLNTTAPITVFAHEWKNQYYNGSWQDRPTAGTYKAYSIIDDDYALLPNGAFFLQCPDEETSITFPTVGRQLTATITDQTGARARLQQPELRKLIDLVLGSGEQEDQTRVVFNDGASMAYETNCDASKFDNEDPTLPQLYTLGDKGTHYAINERPVKDGRVQLGLTIPQDGSYTLRVGRNRQAGTVLLLDKKTGFTADITETGYTFTADKGTVEDRFELIASTLVTDITELNQEASVAIAATDGGVQTTGPALAYGLDGRLVGQTRGGFMPLQTGVYIVRTGKQSVKVTVK